MEERIQVLELALASAQSERNVHEEENILQDLTENAAKFQQFYSSYAKYVMARQQAQAYSLSQSHLAPNPPQLHARQKQQQVRVKFSSAV
jgi:hypothetical protein